MLNTILLRNLHQETLRADANEQRLKELEEITNAQAKLEIGMKDAHGNEISQRDTVNKDLKKGIINYELERNREQMRSKVIHERNQLLVTEMADLRAEVNVLRKENETLKRKIPV